MEVNLKSDNVHWTQVQEPNWRFLGNPKWKVSLVNLLEQLKSFLLHPSKFFSFSLPWKMLKSRFWKLIWSKNVFNEKFLDYAAKLKTPLEIILGIKLGYVGLWANS